MDDADATREAISFAKGEDLDTPSPIQRFFLSFVLSLPSYSSRALLSPCTAIPLILTITSSLSQIAMFCAQKSSPLLPLSLSPALSPSRQNGKSDSYLRQFLRIGNSTKTTTERRTKRKRVVQNKSSKYTLSLIIMPSSSSSSSSSSSFFSESPI